MLICSWTLRGSNMLSSTVKRYMSDPVKTYFGLSKIQVKFFKINVMILLKEPSKEKALLTLHVMTEMHFLLRKT